MVKKEKKVTRIDPVRTTQPLEQTQEKRVCAYCRISTDSEDQKHSLEAQVAYYSRLIGERNNWIFSGIYADEDVGIYMPNAQYLNTIFGMLIKKRKWNVQSAQR